MKVLGFGVSGLGFNQGSRVYGFEFRVLVYAYPLALLGVKLLRTRRFMPSLNVRCSDSTCAERGIRASAAENEAPNPEPQALNLNPKPQTPNPKPQTPNPKPQTPNPKPQTLNFNPKP